MTERTYMGCTIDRAFPSGYWRCLSPDGCGWLKADTLAGLKELIRKAKRGELIWP